MQPSARKVTYTLLANAIQECTEDSFMTGQQDKLEQAIALHQNGQVDAAGRIYEQLLAENPRLAEAWNLSGVLAYQSGQSDRGLQHMRHAIHLAHDVPRFHFNLATALVDSGRPMEGLNASRECLRLDSKHNLAWSVQGNALLELQHYEEAIACFERALQIDNTFVDAWANLARLYRETGNYERAEVTARKALQLNGRHFNALNNLGSILLDTNRASEAVDQFVAALKIKSTSTVAVNLGNALQKCGRLHEAGSAFERALELDQNNANAWNSAGNYFQLLAQIDRALNCFHTAYQLDPMHVGAGTNYLFCVNLTESISRADAFSAHTTWGRQLARREVPPVPRRDRRSDRLLRVGYLSPDFRKHPLATFVRPMFAAHNREHFHITGYSDCPIPDAVTQKIEESVDVWKPIHGMDDKRVWDMIRSDEIDILVDLAGHTANNRLTMFAHRAAPVQVSMLGYLNTTGLAEMDYVVSDAIRDPSADDGFYTETVIRLPHGGCCWEPPAGCPEPVPPPFTKNGHITFGSTHRPNKLTQETLQLWSRVMQSVDDARLLLFHNCLTDRTEMQGHLCDLMTAAGIDLDRVNIAWDDSGEYLPAYHEIDILLEAVPWSSGTTALDALWMGVPLPTIFGHIPTGRPTASVLHRMGLNDLIAHTCDEYIEIIKALADEPDRLVELRSELRRRMQETVCDADSFVRDLETAYRQMWKVWCNAS